MKKTLLLLGAIILLFAGCKKDDVIEASKVEIKNERVERGWDYLKFFGEYSYPQDLEGMKFYLSENADMSGAKSYSCVLEGRDFACEATDLKAGKKYHYYIEYDNGYEKQKNEVAILNTVAKPVVTTKTATEVTAASAFLNGSVTNSDAANNIQTRGFCWSTSQNPDMDDEVVNNGSSSGTGTSTFTHKLENLTENTTYYYRAYTTTNYGTVYGEEKSFKTLEITMPAVATSSVTDIKANSAECGGSVTSDGNGTVTARGVCWSTNPNPTINDNKTSNGSGTGSFTSNLTNLTENTTYYVRAYATNEKGTSYGEEKSFKTLKVFDETIDSNGNRIITLYGDVVFTMIKVEGGTFQMGATSEQGSDADSNEEPVHSVTLSDYYIGETEVTQELWVAVMGSNPSYFSGNQKPVEDVSWNDCKEFITNLNNLTGMNFRLPTEAEWEYAARGGNKSQGYKYSGSNTIGNVAWYGDNSGEATHNVKTKSPNELGIYDMSGNVYEWCEDWYGNYSSSSQTNPTGPSTGSYRVLRGGSWYGGAKYCRVSLRLNSDPGNGYFDYGFRLALSQ